MDEETVTLSDPSTTGDLNPGGEDRGDIVASAPEPGAASAPPASPPPPAPLAAATAPEPGDGDADPAGPGEDGGAPERRPESIPKARFNEVNEQRKQAEARVAELEQQLRQQQPAAAAPAPAPAAEAFDVQAKEREYLKALMAGEDEKALEIRGAINAHILTEAETRVETRMTRRQAQTDLDTAAVEAVAAYPWLNEAEHAETLELITASRDARMAKGMPAGQALRQAVAAIAPRFAPAASAPAPGKGLADAPAPEDTRPANAVRRGASDSQAQPPAVQAGLGNRATAARIDVAELSEDQFASLTEAEKRKLRGD